MGLMTPPGEGILDSYWQVPLLLFLTASYITLM